MAVTADIARTWRRPGQVLSGLLGQGAREDRALMYLMTGCALVFVAQWPRLARVAALTEVGLDRLIGYEVLAWLFVWPLAFYVLAGALWALLRLVRLRISAFAVRLALFWGWLAATPAALLYGLQVGLNGYGPGAHVLGLLWLGAVLLFWGAGLGAALRARPAQG
ncbi:hypothetical protein [Pseudoroseicyclus aestuarii]|uniref:Yip1-like protein n=1 Tax=Pseudoroseicyclus aestuarii TaxID=1795041 RepID=A0A318SNY7_9RHOB|nr:hypothetical protein [Pseudoroseicyclus aestuarii]PYE81295.1 hypothetical protein DFP88_10785 [Pseudoroseicyclus aestuarii]